MRCRRVIAAAAAVAVLLNGCGTASGDLPASATPPSIDLGTGLIVQPSQIDYWLSTHPGDARASAIAAKIGHRPTALWLTGAESFSNLAEVVGQAGREDGTALLAIYNLPLRNDGISGSNTAISAADYRSFIDRVVAAVGSTRAVVVLEPDGVWLLDRETPTGSQRADRIASMRYAVAAFAAHAPRTRVYIEAGTSSGSVTPARMAELLDEVGVSQAAGFAVNVSSYAPTAQITRYAQHIRTALAKSHGVADPRYVVDTSRNGSPTWNTEWCNPSGRTVGVPPALVDDRNGLDFTLWVKAPGTSDGSCGNGVGSTGGEFLPDVALAQASG